MRRLLTLLKYAMVAFVATFTVVFGAVSWVISHDEPILADLKVLFGKNELFFSVAVPTILGLIATIVILIAVSNRRPGSDVRGFPINKIEKLRWSALTARERATLYSEFQKLAPTSHAQIAVAAPQKYQLECQEENPIDLSYLQMLNSMFNVGFTSFTFPFSKEEFSRFTAFQAALIEKLSNSTRVILPVDAQSALATLYDYLSVLEKAPSINARRAIDCIIVGASRWSHQQRVDEAIKQAKLSNCDIILTGGRPSYDDSKQPPVAESEMMLQYLEQRCPRESRPNVCLETRSRNSSEALFHSKQHLVAITKRLGHPSAVGLISSSYHMRRFMFTAERQFSSLDHIVSSITPLTVPASEDFGSLLLESKPITKRALRNFQIFLSEYLKLVGGRVIGEF